MHTNLSIANPKESRYTKSSQEVNMTKTFVPDWYDPPSGWQFGFPKAWPKGLVRSDETLAAQLKADGYPAHEIPVAIGHTRFGGHFE
jgi:hypothetical protein